MKNIDNYIFNGSEFVSTGSRGPKKHLSESEMAKILLDDFTMEEIPNKLRELKLKKLEPVTSKDELLADRIRRINPFQYLKIIQSSKLLVIWEKGDKIEILGPLESLNPKELDNLFSIREPEMMIELRESISSLINDKCSGFVSNAEVLEICINSTNLKATLPRIQTTEEDIHPTVVESCDVPSLRKIPYTKKDTDINQLNPYLQEFLSRTENHKHLCAIIWGQLTGKQWPYVCYLYGKNGREGKTSFIVMLGALTKSYANFTEDSRFALFSLYGKSIIMVPENDRSRLVSSKTIKAITGGNLLSIEEKGKNSFSGMIRGTILVDANVPLRISGRSFETERLRYFTVQENPIVKENRISPAKYRTELGSTPNEFLNYCRQCCEELITAGDMLKEPDNHENIMISLADIEQDYEYGILLNKLLKEMKFQLKPNLKAPKAELLSRARALSANKREFYRDSFVQYLEKKGIQDEGTEFIGIGYVSDNHTHFVLPNS